MTDRYFFDKRDWKRKFIKYGIICAISFFPIVLFNMYCSQFINKHWLLIFIDSVILLVFVVIGNNIANKIFEKKDAKLEKRKKERQELLAKKKKIMEDSYKKIREEKASKKNSGTNSSKKVNKVSSSTEIEQKTNKSKTEDVKIIEVTEESVVVPEKNNKNKGRK
jgi:amino acid permease